MAEFELEPHHARLLTLAAEAWDRSREARQTLEESGMFYTNKAGEPRSHPAVAIERDSRIAYARLLREVDLDGYPEPDTRVPRIASRT